MLKVLLASGVAASAVALASPAHADVYLNPEYNVANYLDTGVGGMERRISTLVLKVVVPTVYIQGGPHGQNS